jgi:hypothetical protein
MGYDQRNHQTYNYLVKGHISAAPAHELYISQLIRYSRACGLRIANKKATEPMVPLG